MNTIEKKSSPKSQKPQAKSNRGKTKAEREEAHRQWVKDTLPHFPVYNYTGKRIEEACIKHAVGSPIRFLSALIGHSLDRLDAGEIELGPVASNDEEGSTKGRMPADQPTLKRSKPNRDDWPKDFPKPVQVEITHYDNERLEKLAAGKGIPEWNLHWLLLDFALTKLEAGEIVMGRKCAAIPKEPAPRIFGAVDKQTRADDIRSIMAGIPAGSDKEAIENALLERMRIGQAAADLLDVIDKQ